MLIEIVTSNLEDKGKYKQLTLAYRSNGKLSEKKLMSFGAGVPAYEVLQKAVAGETFEVTTSKNDKGFWDWTAAGKAAAGAGEAAPQRAAAATPSKSFETPEERALRQVLIVRQSSLSNAIEFLSHSKKAFGIPEVTEVAEAFSNFVFQKDTKMGMADILDMENDIPL